MSVLDKIREAKDFGEANVRIEQWDVDLLIIEPSRKIVMELREKYELKFDPNDGKLLSGDLEGFGTASMVAMVHDLDRKRVFESIEQAEEVLGGKSARAVVELVLACQNFAKEPDAEKIEEAEGNSDGIQS